MRARVFSARKKNTTAGYQPGLAHLFTAALWLTAGCLAPWNAIAAEVTLLPNQSTALPGELITVDLFGDFSDESTLGGGMDINFDAAILDFESFTPSAISDAVYERAPIVSAGQLNGIAFGSFNGINNNVFIGRFEFKVSLDAEEGPTEITVDVNTGIAGPFTSNEDFMQQTVGFQPANIDIAGEIIHLDGFESALKTLGQSKGTE